MGNTWAIKQSRELANKTQVIRIQSEQTMGATKGYKEQNTGDLDKNERQE